MESASNISLAAVPEAELEKEAEALTGPAKPLRGQQPQKDRRHPAALLACSCWARSTIVSRRRKPVQGLALQQQKLITCKTGFHNFTSLSLSWACGSSCDRLAAQRAALS